MPTNLYGPGDNYDPKNSHVFASLIRKFSEAKFFNKQYETGTLIKKQIANITNLSSTVLISLLYMIYLYVLF